MGFGYMQPNAILRHKTIFVIKLNSLFNILLLRGSKKKKKETIRVEPVRILNMRKYC